MDALIAEAAMDLMNEAREREPISVRASVPPDEFSRKGNILMVSGKRVGSISYLLHWTPPSISATCSCHEEGCYVTGSLAAVDEDQLQDWLYQGPRFDSKDAHLLYKPRGSYNQRRSRN